VKRNLVRLCRELIEPPIRIEVRLLKDVGRVDTAIQKRIEPHRDRIPQGRPQDLEGLGQRQALAARRTFGQNVGDVLRWLQIFAGRPRETDVPIDYIRLSTRLAPNYSLVRSGYSRSPSGLIIGKIALQPRPARRIGGSPHFGNAGKAELAQRPRSLIA
jgi:hypothetical protein